MITAVVFDWAGTLTPWHRVARLDVGDHPRPDAALDAYHQWWDPHTWIDPQAPALLEELHDNGFKVGVLSNTIWSRERHEEVFERDGVLHLIDGAVYSSEIAVTKPHPEAFRAAARAVGAEPEQVAFVGDRPFEDVHGAQRAGMRAIFVPHSDIPLDQQVSVDARPDATVQQLSDVLDVVTGWNTGR